jgi:hypothetical protein
MPFTPIDTAMLRKNRYYRSELVKAKEADLKIKTLESVTVRARQRSESQKLDEKFTSGMFSGGDAYVFNIEGDPTAVARIDIFSYLQGRIPGLQIITNGPTPSLAWRGSPPTLYLNEMQVDAGLLSNTQVADVAMIKVFRPGSMVGFGGSPGGAIAVYTKKGGNNNKNNADFKGLDKALLTGYSTMKQFYSTDYIKDPPPDGTPDLRTTLYWKPYIFSDRKTGRTTVEFFNNDISRRLRIVLEGINSDGKLARIEKIIQ